MLCHDNFYLIFGFCLIFSFYLESEVALQAIQSGFCYNETLLQCKFHVIENQFLFPTPLQVVQARSYPISSKDVSAQSSGPGRSEDEIDHEVQYWLASRRQTARMSTSDSDTDTDSDTAASMTVIKPKTQGNGQTPPHHHHHHHHHKARHGSEHSYGEWCRGP